MSDGGNARARHGRQRPPTFDVTDGEVVPRVREDGAALLARQALLQQKADRLHMKAVHGIQEGVAGLLPAETENSRLDLNTGVGGQGGECGARV